MFLLDSSSFTEVQSSRKFSDFRLCLEQKLFHIFWRFQVFFQKTFDISNEFFTNKIKCASKAAFFKQGERKRLLPWLQPRQWSEEEGIALIFVEKKCFYIFTFKELIFYLKNLTYRPNTVPESFIIH